jgi:endonuclease YncB( thermonuclease family)
MKKRLVLPLILLFLTACNPFAVRQAEDRQPRSQEPDNVIEGRVIRVADGDTITILDANNRQLRVRLATIDAPEAQQDFGQRARQNLNELVYGKEVTIESAKRDQYGRIVGKVIIDQKDVNLEQIRQGFAWHYRRHANEQTPEDKRLYAEAETEAKREKRGLWSGGEPSPPWQWRKDRAENEEELNDSPDAIKQGSVF